MIEDKFGEEIISEWIRLEVEERCSSGFCEF